MLSYSISYMISKSMLIYLLLLLSLVSNSQVSAFADYELDLYDLVEEVNGTFYEFLGVDQKCDSAAIRKAYRKLSLILHPDKNKEEDAELKFRQLVAIYEILKSSEKRQRYDEVLVNGLPDWRQPVYYYRKVRKLGLAESSLLLLLAMTTIHYAMMWAAYWEKRYAIEDNVTNKLKRSNKMSKKHIERNDQLLMEMEEEMTSIKSPRLLDLLPFRLAGLVYSTACLLINYLKQVREKKKVPCEDEDNTDEDETSRSTRPVRSDEIFSNMQAPETVESLTPVIYQTIPEKIEDNSSQTKAKTEVQNTKWTDMDDSKLAQAMQRFPQGTSLRWEKIAQQINRTPKDALNRAKILNSQNYTQPTSKPTATIIKPTVTQASAVQEDTTPKLTSSDSWSQAQQKALEAALVSVSKSEVDRWSVIAEKVPGKNKLECMKRYKYLAEKIKNKATAS